MSEITGRIHAAATAFDWAAVDRAASDFVLDLRARAQPSSREEYHPVLELLLDHRRYDALVRVVDELLGRGVEDPLVRRHYGQAQIEQGFPSAALATLTTVAVDPDATSEVVESRGLMSRCHKELYLRTVDPGRRAEELRLALSGYLDAYLEDPSRRYWLGINAVALLARAAGEGIDLPGHPSPGEESRRLATGVLDTVGRLRDDDVWAQATAVEALVALGDTDGAERQLERYIDQAAPNAFALNSLLRQLTEIWALDVATPPGSTLLPQLRSELLDKTGGQVSLDPGEIRAERLERLSRSEHLEKVLGTDRYQTLSWYLRGLDRCRAVARIETENEDGVGTGFLVVGADLAPGLPEVVLMTNGHVVPETLDIDEAVVSFHAAARGSGEPQRFGVLRQWWYRPSQAPELDTTLLELDGLPADVTPLPLAAKVPRLRGQATPRAYVIGHPRGLEQPQFSLQDNHILDYDDTRLHYRSPTEGGSSGSPVFDKAWNLIGIHHAGSLEMRRLHGPGFYPANEGIRLSAIITALREEGPSP